MTATREQVVQHFLSLKYSEWTQTNWGLHSDRTYWYVDEDTYINGVPLIIDLDFEMGYLLEIVEKLTGVVSYVVVVTGTDEHDSTWYEKDIGTFFDRNMDTFEMIRWATPQIEGLLEAQRELQRTEDKWND